MTWSAPAAGAASPAHRHRVDADHRVAPGRQAHRRRELADDAQAEHRGRPAERQPGPEHAAEPVAGDARQGRLLRRQAVRHLPQPAALVADRQQLVRGVVAGIADAVAGLPALECSDPTATTLPAAL